jgi:archaellum biogenesis ATPase FlaH
LTQMKEILKFGIEKCNPDIIILDSLSQFVNFSQSSDKELRDLSLFLQTLRNDVLNIHQKTVLLLYDTKLGSPRIHPDITIDMMLKIEVIKKNHLDEKHKLLLNY